MQAFYLGEKIKFVAKYADPKPHDWEINGEVETIGTEIYPTSKSNFAIYDKNAIRVRWQNGMTSVRWANSLIKDIP